MRPKFVRHNLSPARRVMSDTHLRKHERLVERTPSLNSRARDAVETFCGLMRVLDNSVPARPRVLLRFRPLLVQFSATQTSLGNRGTAWEHWRMAHPFDIASLKCVDAFASGPVSRASGRCGTRCSAWASRR